MSFDRFDPDVWLSGGYPATPATVATVEKDTAPTVATVATVAARAPQNPKIRSLPDDPLSAVLEAILAGFPGAEIVGLTRYDVPDPSQLEPLAMAGHWPGVCAQCRDPDGQATRWLDKRRNGVVWLHTECRRRYRLTSGPP